jgi:hypothetical protein
MRSKDEDNGKYIGVLRIRAAILRPCAERRQAGSLLR